MNARPKTLAVALAGAALVMAACGKDSRDTDEGDQPSSEGGQPSSQVVALVTAPGSDSIPGADSVSDAADGISADEARDLGVFAGPFDARVLVSHATETATTFEVTNIGDNDDVYGFEVRPRTAAVVEPTRAAVRAGDSITVTIYGTESGTLVVTSEGRGDEVADEPFG
jgi:hypothetical protein